MEVLNDILSALVGLIPRIAAAIFVFTFGFPFVNFLISRVKRRVLKRRPDIDADVMAFSERTLKLFLRFLVIIIGIGILGVQTTSLAAAIGAIGFAVGLALQGALGNLAAGILVLLFKPYRSGDWITAQGFSGTVHSIHLFSTIIVTLDNHRVIIPNGSIVSGPIENFSIEQLRQHNITVGIGYKDDIRKARAIVRRVIDQCTGLQAEPEPQVLVSELGDSSVNLSARFWTTNEDFWPAHFQFHENIKFAFDKEGITIPYPQMEVTLPGAGESDPSISVPA